MKIKLCLQPHQRASPNQRIFGQKRNSKSGAKITADDICFFNGPGDAISKIYTYLRKETRIIGPSRPIPPIPRPRPPMPGIRTSPYNLCRKKLAARFERFGK